MGRIYRSIIVAGKKKEKLTVVFVDSGADETVISQRLADEIGCATVRSLSFVLSHGPGDRRKVRGSHLQGW